ncbi:MAG: LysR family transcriptional regulator [Oscillospiraceae bacterium]
MEVKLMKEFIVLAETCNFQEAAERLYISASSLSKHVKIMEEEFGVPMFDRTTRNVKLNKCGETFYEYAKQMVKLYDECTTDLNELRINRDCYLSIGFLPKFEPSGIVEVLSDFAKQRPDLTLHMVATNQPKELLRAHRCNFVFTGEDCERDSDIDSFLYKTDNLVAVFPLTHPMAKEKHVTVDQLRDENFIMHSDIAGDTTMAAQTFQKLCLEAGFVPKVVMTASYSSTVVKLAKRGEGIAIMNRMFVPAAFCPDVAIVDIYPIVPLSVYVLHMSKTRMFPAERDFLRYIKSLCEGAADAGANR